MHNVFHTLQQLYVPKIKDIYDMYTCVFNRVLIKNRLFLFGKIPDGGKSLKKLW